MAKAPPSRLPDILSQGFYNFFDVCIFAGNDACYGKLSRSDNQIAVACISSPQDA